MCEGESETYTDGKINDKFFHFIFNINSQLWTETTLVSTSEVGELTTFSGKMYNHLVISIGNRYFQSILVMIK